MVDMTTEGAVSVTPSENARPIRNRKLASERTRTSNRRSRYSYTIQNRYAATTAQSSARMTRGWELGTGGRGLSREQSPEYPEHHDDRRLDDEDADVGGGHRRVALGRIVTLDAHSRALRSA